MTKKSTKSALFTSSISLLLSFSMLLGTTFAWFTDTVTSANNIIKSGNLDVEFDYWDGDSWETVKDADDILTNDLWEPGVTEIAYLRVVNKGSLALKYQLGVNIVSETEGKNVAGETFKLSDSLMFGMLENKNGQTEAFSKDDAGRAAAIAELTAANKISAGYTKESEIKATDANLEHYFALVVYMPTTVGNEANHNGNDIPKIDLGINVYATQVENEKDSFGDDYDEDAKYPMVATKVSTEADLEEVLSEGGWAVLTNDIVLSETLTLNKDSKVIMDLGGFKIKCDGSLTTLIEATKGNIIIKNGTIEHVHDNATSTLISVSLSGDSVTEITNVNIKTSGTGIYLDDNAKITELNAVVESFANANGTCVFDAVSVNGNARIDIISGGTYTSNNSEDFIESWYNDSTHTYKGTASYPININSATASIGEISGGTFLGEMDKANNGTPIHINAGTLEKISGGYFGFCKWGLTNPTKMIFVNSGNGGSIGKIVGGTFEAGNPAYNGAARFGCDFEGIVDASGCRVVDTGTTVEAKVQFSTRVATYTLNVLEVVSK